MARLGAVLLQQFPCNAALKSGKSRRLGTFPAGCARPPPPPPPPPFLTRPLSAAHAPDVGHDRDVFGGPASAADVKAEPPIGRRLRLPATSSSKRSPRPISAGSPPDPSRGLRRQLVPGSRRPWLLSPSRRRRLRIFRVSSCPGYLKPIFGMLLDCYARTGERPIKRHRSINRSRLLDRWPAVFAEVGDRLVV